MNKSFKIPTEAAPHRPPPPPPPRAYRFLIQFHFISFSIPYSIPFNFLFNSLFHSILLATAAAARQLLLQQPQPLHERLLRHLPLLQHTQG